jgi:hypothetical protein
MRRLPSSGTEAATTDPARRLEELQLAVALWNHWNRFVGSKGGARMQEGTESLLLDYWAGPQIKLDISLGNDLSMKLITLTDVSTHLRRTEKSPWGWIFAETPPNAISSSWSRAGLDCSQCNQQPNLNKK